MRKIFILMLLIAGWAIIFYPLAAVGDIPVSTAPSMARPSNRPLSPAWEGTERVQVRLPGGEAAGQAAGQVLEQPAPDSDGGSCGSSYTIQPGDSLGKVAQKCGLSLAELLAANPKISNPNRVYTNQVIDLPDPKAGRGGGDPLMLSESAAAASGFTPGAAVEIDTGGLPPNTSVRIGVGLTSSGYRQVSEGQTDADGRLLTRINLPGQARSGDEAFVMVTAQGIPVIQRMSDTFTIGR